jgi:cupin 2 domain-containing protein
MANYGNIFTGLPWRAVPEEVVAELLTTPNLRIERIVSTGQASPAHQWYDQDWDEWVILLRGGAQLLFEDEAQARILDPGDYVYIPAHCRHRVLRTDPQQVTVWLPFIFADTSNLHGAGRGRAQPITTTQDDDTGERATYPSNRRAANRHGGDCGRYSQLPPQFCRRSAGDIS